MSTHFRIPVSAVRVAIAAAFLLAGPASLAVDSWGTQTSAYSLNCSSADCSGGGTGGGDSVFAPDDVNYQGSPSTNSLSGPLGMSTVTAAFEMAAPGLATMKQTAEATSTETGAAIGNGHTLDFVSYSGPPTTITITVDLTGTHTGPTSGADSGLDGLDGTVMVFTDAFGVSEIDIEMSPRLNCLFECYLPDDSASVSIADGSTPDSATMTLNLDDGDGFYIYGQFNIGAAGGGLVSSVDSFTYSFSPTTGLTSLAGSGGGSPDTDMDGLTDDTDNCILVSNPGQQDSNGDGYGNACDADINNDGSINAIDLGLFKSVFFSADADADFNSDGTVNAIDLGVLKASFFGTPGPSAFAP